MQFSIKRVLRTFFYVVAPFVVFAVLFVVNNSGLPHPILFLSILFLIFSLLLIFLRRKTSPQDSIVVRGKDKFDVLLIFAGLIAVGFFLLVIYYLWVINEVARVSAQ